MLRFAFCFILLVAFPHLWLVVILGAVLTFIISHTIRSFRTTQPLVKLRKPADPVFYHKGGCIQQGGPWEYEGWYFWDETWAFYHGPFTTESECRVGIDTYVTKILNETTIEKDEKHGKSTK